jgi:predicted TPR repeat methyltransferase
MSIEPVSADGEEEEERPVGLAEALAIAVNAHRSGRLADAETLYDHILEAEPEQVDALHFLGVLHHQTGRSERAIELIRRAIDLLPDFAAPRINLGNILVARGAAAEATDSYRSALALQPDNLEALNNLGTVLKALRRFDEAEAQFQKALAVAPEHKLSLMAMSKFLIERDRPAEALTFCWRALVAEPRSETTPHRILAAAYHGIGDREKARDVLRQWVEAEPDDAVARHLYVAAGGEEMPARAADRYVEEEFDGFAASFDAKLQDLRYRAPEYVQAAVAAHCGPPQADRDCLDAGCGTGLCGPLIAPYVRRLTGVDLSGRMLDGARARGGYDELVRAELTAFIEQHADAYDLIVSADTLVYFGALDAVLNAAARALRPGGVLVFTVEEGGDAARGYTLDPHGRYSHDAGYLARTIAAAGLDLATLERVTLREENAQPVAGFVVTARR